MHYSTTLKEIATIYSAFSFTTVRPILDIIGSSYTIESKRDG